MDVRWAASSSGPCGPDRYRLFACLFLATVAAYFLRAAFSHTLRLLLFVSFAHFFSSAASTAAPYFLRAAFWHALRLLLFVSFAHFFSSAASTWALVSEAGFPQLPVTAIGVVSLITSPLWEVISVGIVRLEPHRS